MSLLKETLLKINGSASMEMSNVISQIRERMGKHIYM